MTRNARRRNLISRETRREKREKGEKAKGGKECMLYLPFEL
jgi:hypothetical protein